MDELQSNLVIKFNRLQDLTVRKCVRLDLGIYLAPWAFLHNFYLIIRYDFRCH